MGFVLSSGFQRPLAADAAFSWLRFVALIPIYSPQFIPDFIPELSARAGVCGGAVAVERASAGAREIGAKTRCSAAGARDQR
jgi:hypothetical protein